MASIKDDKGYNQGFKPSEALRIRTERRCDYIISRMGAGKGGRVLEIGCGTGEMAYLLARKTGMEVTGTDICGPFIDEARKNYTLANLRYEQLDFNDRDAIDRTLGNRGFDYVVGNGVLHHLYYTLTDALRNIRLLLNGGGRVVFLEPNILNPYCLLIFKVPYFRRLASLEPGEMAFTRGEISEKLAGAGFADIAVEYRDFLLPGTPGFLIKPLIALGDAVEKLPFLRWMSQSVYITASKKQ